MDKPQENVEKVEESNACCPLCGGTRLIIVGRCATCATCGWSKCEL